MIPNKDELNVIKIYTHKGEAGTVYTNSRNPILFEIEKALYPTGMGSAVEESALFTQYKPGFPPLACV